MTQITSLNLLSSDDSQQRPRNLEQFRLLVENSMDLIAELNADQRILYVSPNVEAILGYQAEQLLGRSVLEKLHPDDVPMVSAYFAIPEGRVTCRFQHRDGSWRWLETTGRDFTSANGQQHSVLIVRDVTDHKEAEEALRHSEERTRLLIEHAMDAVVILSAEGLVTSWNSQAREIFGWACDEVMGKPLAALLFPNGGESEYESTLQRLVTIEPGGLANQRWETSATCRDGRELAVEMAITLLPTSQGASFSVFIRDLTGLKAAQEARVQIEHQLRQAQKFSALGTLAGGIAHDFNNILGAIIAYTDLIRMQTQDQRGIQDDLGQVLKASERAKSLVQQILTFSRRQSTERKPVRLQLILEEALKLIRSIVPKSIEFVVEVDRNAAPVLADTTQFYQVLVNLCTNAAHAMRNRPGKLKVSLRTMSILADHAETVPGLHTGLYTRLSVRDTGHGMDEETLSQIFEPGFTTKRQGEGTGLGLAVVQGIMRDHNGAIEVASQPGMGTTFHLYFPVHAGELLKREPEPDGIPRGRGERLLFVDDEPCICTVMQKVLEKLGYVVTTHCWPQVALEEFRAGPNAFDLVITNFNMPGMSGLDMAVQMRLLRPQLPVLLTTGYCDTHMLETSRRAGIHDVVTKPILTPRLAEAVHRALRGLQPAAA